MPSTWLCYLIASTSYEYWVLPSLPPTVWMGKGDGMSCAWSAVHFVSLLKFTASHIIICARNSNSTASEAWNLMTWSGPPHGCGSFQWEVTAFMYVIGRSLVLNITRSPTSLEDIHWLLSCSPIWLSCAPWRLSEACSCKAGNRSMKGMPSKLDITLCRNLLATNFKGTDCKNPEFSSHGLRLVDECVDMLYIYSGSYSMVSQWSRWQVATVCRYRVTCLFEISYSLSVCGWNGIEMSSLRCNL